MDNWQFLCFVSGTFSHFLAILEFVLLASISGYKLYTLLKPFQSRLTITPAVVRAWIVFLVVICALFRFSTLIWGMSSIYIEEMLTCEPSDLHTQEKPWIEFAYAVVIIFAIVPLTIILVSNVGIIVVASRHALSTSDRESKPNSMKLPSKSALVTVSTISWLFVISVTPVFVRIIIEKMGRGPLPNWYLVLQKQMFWLNVVFNPVCYSLSCKHFKDYLIGALSCGTNENNIVATSNNIVSQSFPVEPTSRLAADVKPPSAPSALQKGFTAIGIKYFRGKKARPQILPSWNWKIIIILNSPVSINRQGSNGKLFLTM